MSEGPPAPPQITYSPDGQFWWDGQVWRPVAAPATVAPPKKSGGAFGSGMMGCFGVGAALLIVAGVLFVGCTSMLAGVSHGLSRSGISASTAPHVVIKPIVLTGTGSKVTDKFDLPAGSYKLTWQASGPSPDNFIVHVHGSAEEGVVNEIPPNPSSGEASFDSSGGATYLTVEASTLTWTITITSI